MDHKCIQLEFILMPKFYTTFKLKYNKLIRLETKLVLAVQAIVFCQMNDLNLNREEKITYKIWN